jgi:hypothetical protein
MHTVRWKEGEMRVAVIVLLMAPLVLASFVLAGDKEHERTYANDEFGFSFVYPVYEGIQVDEKGPDQRFLEDFKVVVSANKPIFSVHVLQNPKNLKLKEFAYDLMVSRGIPSREQVGCEEITVAGEKAVRMTYFGGECAATQVFVLHGGKIFQVRSWCSCGLFPEILATFQFHARAGNG